MLMKCPAVRDVPTAATPEVQRPQPGDTASPGRGGMRSPSERLDHEHISVGSEARVTESSLCVWLSPFLLNLLKQFPPKRDYFFLALRGVLSFRGKWPLPEDIMNPNTSRRLSFQRLCSSFIFFNPEPVARVLEQQAH